MSPNEREKLLDDLSERVSRRLRSPEGVSDIEQQAYERARYEIAEEVWQTLRKGIDWDGEIAQAIRVAVIGRLDPEVSPAIDAAIDRKHDEIRRIAVETVENKTTYYIERLVADRLQATIREAIKTAPTAEDMA